MSNKHQSDSNMKKWVVFLLVLAFLLGMSLTMAQGALTLANNKPTKVVTNDMNLIKVGSNNVSMVHPDVHMADTYVVSDLVAVDSKTYEMYPDPIPTPGPDLTFTEVKEYRYHNPANDDGNHDMYTIDFVVKNIGSGTTGETNIAYATNGMCEGGGVETGPIQSQPHLVVPPLGSGEETHVILKETEEPGCQYSYLGIYVNIPPIGCFGPDADSCIPTKEVKYTNNYFSGVFSIPDKKLPYSSSSSSALTNSQIADAVFTKINEVRAKYQKSALIRNTQLDKIAQGFSDSMATTLTYPSGAHEAGGNAWSGTDGRMKQILKMGFAYPAENIMKVSPSANKFGCDGVSTTVGNTATGIAAYTILSWVEHDSCANPPDGHKKTVLSDPANYGGTSNYLPTDVGIGVAKGSDGNYYITADFAHK